MYERLLESRGRARRGGLPGRRELRRRATGLVDLPGEPRLLVGSRRDRTGDRGHDADHRGALVAERAAHRADDRRLPADLVPLAAGALYGPDRPLSVGDPADPGEGGLAQRALLLAADVRVRGGPLRRVLRVRAGAPARRDPPGRRAGARAPKPGRRHPPDAVARDGLPVGIRPRDVAGPQMV